jgi:hypothetical protein
MMPKYDSTIPNTKAMMRQAPIIFLFRFQLYAVHRVAGASTRICHYHSYFDRWIDSVTHMTVIVPQPDHRLG